MIFESHAHYDDEQFDTDRQKVLNGLKEGGVDFVVNVGSDVKASRLTLELTREYPFLYGTVGIHPEYVKDAKGEDFEAIREMAKKPKVVAVGETGLDYYWDKEGKEKQIEWFIRHMDLAREAALPLVVHSREAAKDTLDVMKANRAEEIGGVVHCFSYSAQMAAAFVDMGFYIGVGGVVTFKNGKNLKEAVRAVPLERILLETDCPYLAPEPYRGKRNQSVYLTYVAKMVAELKGVHYDDVVRETRKNALCLYRMGEG